MSAVVRTIRVACNTGTGTQDITTSKMGGLTPVAALFTWNYATADGTAADHYHMGMGAATGATVRWAIMSIGQHNVASADTQSYATASYCVIFGDPTSLPTDETENGAADFDSFITNGVRIDWGSNPPSAAYLLTVTLIAGTDVANVKAGYWDDLGDTVDSTADVNTVGFNPELLWTGITNISALDTATANSGIGIGFAERAGKQISVCQTSLDAANDGDPKMYIREDAGIVWIDPTAALDWYGEFGSFDSSGFSVTTRNAGANNQILFYLAVDFGRSVVIDVNYLVTPTATGSWSTVRPLVKPQYMMMLHSGMEALNTYDASDNAGTLGISMADATNQYSTSCSDEDASADTDTQSLSDDTLINNPFDDGTTEYVATLTSFDARGATFNFSTAPSTAKYIPYLVIGEIPVEGSGVHILPSATTYKAQTNTGSVGITIARPAGLADDDVLYCIITKDWSGGAAWALSGWTRVAEQNTTAGRDGESAIMRKVISTASSEADEYTFTNGDSDPRDVIALCFIVRGADTTTPEDVTTTESNGVDNDNPSSPSITPTTDGCLIIPVSCLFAAQNSGYVTWAAPTNYAINGPAQSYGTTSQEVENCVASDIQVSAQATGAIAWNNTAVSNLAEWHTYTVAVKPGAAPVAERVLIQRTPNRSIQVPVYHMQL